MEMSLQKGTTGQIVLIRILDDSGDPLTGLLYNTASLAASYYRNTASAKVSITLADVSVMGTFASGGFKETSIAGIYALHIPNAALADGADQVLIELSGAASMAAFSLSIQLLGQASASASGSISGTLSAEDVLEGAKRLLQVNPNDPQWTDGQLIADLGRIQSYCLNIRADLLRDNDGAMASLTWPTDKADTLILSRRFEQNLIYLLAAWELGEDSADTGNAALAAAWRKLGERGLIA